ncbi:GNAT family N-acetyltransferase [Paenibacillus sp.]|uniref:GNAT family N-acetyltransferase n=1 Tax=Paenibacillus sp. TaxID=58172 RepID=UPI0028214D35|nr:GNAT family N-acetyltransferase [Paenibacillus sp.]MDR0269787.1 GNAT family N-acetyltransferase [Paenibacillus sp.]
MNDLVEIIKVREDQKSILKQLIELYEYDFSEFNEADINQYGFYDYKYFDHYWTEENRQAYFVKVSGQYAGFVLVNDHCYLVHNNSRAIAEFFIMRKYRRKGIGKVVSKLIFDTHRGYWEVLQHGNNPISKEFWESAIRNYTHGDYSIQDVKTEYWEGQGIIFKNSEG